MRSSRKKSFSLKVENLEARDNPSAIQPLRVALVSDAVAQSNEIASAAGSDVVVRTFSGESTADLVAVLQKVTTEYGAPIGHLAIVGHGSVGRVEVSSRLSWANGSWNSEPEAWAEFRSLLTDDARLDLYACNVAATRIGRSFISELRQQTGADLFASSNAVGSGKLGDFNWEVRSRTAYRSEIFTRTALESIDGLKLVDDPYEPNDTQVDVDNATQGATNSSNFGPLASTLTINGLQLEDSGDWYKFSTSGIGTSHDFVQIAFNSAQGDVDLELRASNGITVLRSDAVSFGSTAEVSLAGYGPGTFYARVFDGAASPAVAYSLTINPSGNEADDPFEGNDTRAEVDANVNPTASNPNFGTLTSDRTENNLRLEDSADWYKFTTNAIGTGHDFVSIAFTPNSGTRDGDVDIELRASDGITVLRSDAVSFGSTASVSLAGLAPATYYVRVYDDAGAAMSLYSMTIDPPGDEVDDAFEGNDTRTEVDANVNPLATSPILDAITSEVQLNNLRLEDSADWYRFTTTSIGTSHDFVSIAFTPNSVTRDGDVDLELRASDGVTVLRSDTLSFGTSASVSLAGLAPGTFYVRVYDDGGAAMSLYSMTVDPPGDEADDVFEGNDTRVEVDANVNPPATSPLFGTLTSEIQFNNLRLEDSADWYRFNTTALATSHDFVSISFTPNSATRDGDIDLEVRAADGVTVLRSDTLSFGTSASVSLSGLAAGTYYVRVFDDGGNAMAPYSMTIDPPGDEPDDAFEGNDTRAEVDANTNPSGSSPKFGTVTSEIQLNNLRLEDSSDWYRFTTAATATSHDFVSITFTPNSATRDGDIDIEIRALDGVTVLRSDLLSFGSSASVSLAGLAADTYYIRVFDDGGNAMSDYSLTLDPPTDEADDLFEDNDSAAQVLANTNAAPNNPDLGVVAIDRVFSNLRLEDSADFYRVTTTATGTSHDFVSISFTPNSSLRDGDIDLELRASDGTTVLKSDALSFGTTAEVSFAGLPAGAYFIRVYDDGGNAMSNYSMTIDPPGDEVDDLFEGNDTRPIVDARVPGETNSPNLGLINSTRQITGLKLEDTDDWFRFEIPATGNSTHFVRATFATNSAQRDGDIDMQIVRPDGSVFASDTLSFGTTAEVSLNTLTAGTYYARLFDTGFAANSDYTLTINPPIGGNSLALSIAPNVISEAAGTNAATGTVTRNGSTAGDLVVTLTSSLNTEATVPLNVTIPNGQASATFPINAIDEFAIDGTKTVAITANASGLVSASSLLSVTDNDAPPAISISESGGGTGVSEVGGTDSYTVVLTTQPSADVVVTVTPDGQLGATPVTLTFTPSNWFVSQTVTVSAINDSLVEGAHSGSISHTSTSVDARYNAIGIPTVNATIIDNDAANVVVVESGGSTSVSEAGGTDTYSIVLQSQPAADVSIVLSTNAQLNATPTQITFTTANWNVPQIVTVSAINDTIGEGAHSAIINHAASSADPNYNGAAVASVTVAIADNDVAPGLLVVPSGAATIVEEAGVTDTYELTLATQPASDVTVTVSFGTQVTATPTTLVFTTSNWDQPRTVTITAVNDVLVEGTQQAIISHTIASGDPNYNNLPAASVVVNIVDNDVTMLAAADIFSTVEDGPAVTFNVLANDTGAAISVSSVTSANFGVVNIVGGGTGIEYVPPSNFYGTDYFTYTITDQNGATSTAGVLVQVSPVNDAPVLTVPGPQAIRANLPTTIAGLAVFDSDVFQGNGQVQVTVSVQNGLLTMTSTTGVNFLVGDGSADSTITIVGPVPSVSNAISNLIYVPNADTSLVDTLNIQVSDLGNFGTGGPQTASGSVALVPLVAQSQVQISPLNARLNDLVVYGSSADDTVVITGAGTTFKVAINGGSPVTYTKITGRVLVFGQAGNDRLDASKIAKTTLLVGAAGNDTILAGSGKDTISGGLGDDSIDGGRGVDRLVESGDVNMALISGTALTNGSMSGLGTDVLVKISIEEADLTGGDGDNVLDANAFKGKVTLTGGNGADVLRSGTGNSLLLGGAGPDQLVGNIGKDVLIGGAGNDTLTGGLNEDLLISGTTLHDSNRLAIESIAAEWFGTSAYATRIKRLLGTAPAGLNRTFRLNATTVFDDGQPDSLVGGGKLDWFIVKDGVDSISDLNDGGPETRLLL